MVEGFPEDSVRLLLSHRENTTLVDPTVTSPTRASYRIDFVQKSLLEISLACLSALANIFIVVLICVNRKYRRRTNFLIANLCLSSVIYNTLMNLRSLEYKLKLEFNYNSFLCGLLAILHRFSLPVMSMTTMAISLERSQSATATIPCQLLPSRTGLKIVTLWLISILITIPCGLANVFDSSTSLQSPRRCIKVLLLNSMVIHIIYIVLHTAIVYIIPTIVLIVELVRMRNKIKFLSHGKHEINYPEDARLRLVRNARIFTALFIIFWLPIGLHATVYDLPQEIFPKRWKLKFLVNFVYLQQITNYFVFSIPIVLFLLSQRLRESLLGYCNTQYRLSFCCCHHFCRANETESADESSVKSKWCILCRCWGCQRGSSSTADTAITPNPNKHGSTNNVMETYN